MSIKKIFLPGDKSISHRVLILSAIADKPTKIKNINQGEDVKSTIRVLRGLGTKLEVKKDYVVVRPRTFSKPRSALNCGNSGTTMRLMAGLLSSSTFSVELTGDKSLLSRPMDRVVNPLSRMRANIECSYNGTGPIKIHPIHDRLQGINYEIPVPSAQVKSSILLAGLNAEGETSVREKIATRDHTEIWLRAFGVDVSEKNWMSKRTQSLKSPGEVLVPGDPTAACYLAVAAVLSRSNSIKLVNVNLNPSRLKWVDILAKMGVIIDIDVKDEAVERSGDILIKSFKKTLKPIEIKSELVPCLIDELPALAVLMTQARGTSIVNGALELRKKESDRIKVLYEGLSNLSVVMKINNDQFSIERATLQGGRVNSYGDHRMAMAFGMCNLVSKKRIYIRGKNSVVISFPGFFRALNRIKKLSY